MTQQLWFSTSLYDFRQWLQLYEITTVRWISPGLNRFEMCLSYTLVSSSSSSSFASLSVALNHGNKVCVK